MSFLNDQELGDMDCCDMRATRIHKDGPIDGDHFRVRCSSCGLTTKPIRLNGLMPKQERLDRAFMVWRETVIAKRWREGRGNLATYGVTP